MNQKQYKIDIEIYIVFIIVIGISVFNAIYSSRTISQNLETTDRIMTVDIPSLQNLENMNLIVTRSKMLSMNWVYLQSNNEDKAKLRFLHTVEYPALKASISSLMMNWKDELEVDTMNAVFAAFEKQVALQQTIMNTLVGFDDYEDPVKRFTAEDIFENQVLPQTTKIIDRLNTIVWKRRATADYRHAEVSRSSRTMMLSVLGIAILIVFVILIAAFYISNHIILPTMRLKNYVLQMGKGEIPVMEIEAGKNAVGQMSAAVQSLSVSLKQTAHFAHSIGEGDWYVEFQPLSEQDELGNALIQMRESLRVADEGNKQRNWILTGTDKVNEVLRENRDDLESLSEGVIRTLVTYVNAEEGNLFLVDEKDAHLIQLHGSFSVNYGKKKQLVLNTGEGLIGQVVLKGNVINEVNPDESSEVTSNSIQKLQTSDHLIVPLKLHGKVHGAVEFFRAKPFEKSEIDFILLTGETIVATIASVRANMLTRHFLDETRLLAEQLQQQEEQLIRTNEELSLQSTLLIGSEEELKASNRELKNNTRELRHKNDVLEQARDALSIKAKELEINNKFKSEFLANMSHELRTPLNSVLILAKLLAEKESDNLSKKQIEYAHVIYKSGSDLLTLINDILDLSKIEAGRVEMVPEDFRLSEFINDHYMLFNPVANEKRIHFVLDEDDTLPEICTTDKMRLGQVLKNLLSNAFKFTPEDGTVVMSFRKLEQRTIVGEGKLFALKAKLQISVTDTGIGIPLEKQVLIFEPFQQADGSTSRRFGGTGLGLSISKTLISLLGGEIQLKSEPGIGSTFSILIPIDGFSGMNASFNTTSISTITRKTLLDDRLNIVQGDRIILIADADFDHASELMDVAHKREYKAIVAGTENDILKCAEEFTPDAILMNMVLEDTDAITVLKAFKSSEILKVIPVHIMPVSNSNRKRYENEKFGFLNKPFDRVDLDNIFSSVQVECTRDETRILLVEESIVDHEIIANLMVNYNKKTRLFFAQSFEEAHRLLKEINIHVVLLDLDFSSGIDASVAFYNSMREIFSSNVLPIILLSNDYSLSDFHEAIHRPLKKEADLQMDSVEHIIRENEKAIGIEKNQNDRIEMSGETKRILVGKTALVVDDDMRNIYAMTKLLESEGMKVTPSVSGLAAMNRLQIDNVLPDIILIDFSLPDIDGFELTKRIRSFSALKSIPIIVLTAKINTEVREKFLQAGANAFLAKPIEAEKLFLAMRIWLFSDSHS